jgi:glutaredoxin-like YruB-family protein
MKPFVALILTAVLTLAAATAFATGAVTGTQSKINPSAPVQHTYPMIVLYSVSWCPHCTEAKEYMTRNKIPFINKDVELDETAMTELSKKYHSQGVPVIVIGSGGKTVLKGFDAAQFEKALKEAKP